MSREIKFRAWDKKSKCMAKLIGFKDLGKAIQVIYLDEDGDETFAIVDKEQIELMQYTGLKDKNSKEIFEGDIVKFEDCCEEGYEYKEGFEFDNIAEVVFENGRYILTNFIESDNSYYADDGIDEALEEVLNGNCEVIGNIYEDKDLLGRK